MMGRERILERKLTDIYVLKAPQEQSERTGGVDLWR